MLITLDESGQIDIKVIYNNQNLQNDFETKTGEEYTFVSL
jgi:hypothetical protein